MFNPKVLAAAALLAAGPAIALAGAGAASAAPTSQPCTFSSGSFNCTSNGGSFSGSYTPPQTVNLAGSNKGGSFTYQHTPANTTFDATAGAASVSFTKDNTTGVYSGSADVGAHGVDVTGTEGTLTKPPTFNAHFH